MARLLDEDDSYDEYHGDARRFETPAAMRQALQLRAPMSEGRTPRAAGAEEEEELGAVGGRDSSEESDPFCPYGSPNNLTLAGRAGLMKSDRFR